MSESRPIFLRFDPQVGAAVRARITYAFRVFAAVYNHRVSEENAEPDALHCFYGGERPQEPGSRAIWIPARYRISPKPSIPGPLTKLRHSDEDFHLLFGVDDRTGLPDWLGEIFAWISCSLESPIVSRDSVDRVPFGEMVFNREGISPKKPYAAMMMAWFENALQKGETAEALPRAPSPLEDARHAVVCTHDVDFYFTDPLSAAKRLLKNLGIAILTYRSWSFFRSNSKMLGQLIGGKRVGDYLPGLTAATGRYEFRSTVFVASNKMHRRDPNYKLGHLASQIADAKNKDFTFGLHGSYQSVVEAQDLRPEVTAMAGLTGAAPVGGRQHWLRFDRHEKLFSTVENAGLLYDSSLGFHDRVGFRNGANFAFPPYDFQNERPHEFLEIPLVIMDGGLQVEARLSGAEPQAIADAVLAESRKWGWGGISVLWHNPVEAIAVPEAINRVFWESVKKQRQFQEKWITADQFIACSLSRYQNAGLLQNARIESYASGIPRTGPLRPEGAVGLSAGPAL